jgi:SpoVK/Ycf46/Vps4 family AAA+-type ATPase
MPFSLDEMRKRFEKYGTIYSKDQIVEDLNDIIGLEDKKELMEDFLLALKKYEELAPNLKKAKIIPNFTILLYGPPGTGKTSLSKAMAKKYDIPIGIVEADRLVSPLLGDTVKNIRSVFELSGEFAKENGSFILFFDEIDAVASERANAHEVGEIKRAVISFLQIIDKISNEAIPLAIFGATNHEGQLDSAVWRRFTYHLRFDFPSLLLRKNIIISFIDRLANATIGIDPQIKRNMTDELAFIEQHLKKKQLSLEDNVPDEELVSIYGELKQAGKASLLYLSRGYTGADLMRAMRVAVFKALQKNILLIADYERALELVGGTKTHFIHGQELAGQMRESSELSEKKEFSLKKSTKNPIKKSTTSIDLD